MVEPNLPLMPLETIETYVVKKQKTQKGKTINQYLVLKQLGEGSTGKVKLVENLENNKKYAMKCFNKTILKKRTKLIKLPDGKSTYKTGLDDVRREIDLIKRLNHPNIIKLVEKIEDLNGHNLYIKYAENREIMVWDEDKQIFAHTCSENKYLEESFIRNVIRDTIKALNYIHNLCVVHRDIKPLNIMLTESFTAKLADFGTAIETQPPNCLIKGSEGTFQFMAPESLKSDGNENGFDGRLADIWSLGVTLYCLAYNKLPFHEGSLVQLIEDIRTKEIVFPKSRTISEELKDLILKMLKKDPKNRITLKELCENAWINKGLQKLKDDL